MRNKDFRKAFGARVKALRKQKRWSQKEQAAKVFIRFQQLNKYESDLKPAARGDTNQIDGCFTYYSRFSADS